MAWMQNMHQYRSNFYVLNATRLTEGFEHVAAALDVFFLLYVCAFIYHKQPLLVKWTLKFLFRHVYVIAAKSGT